MEEAVGVCDDGDITRMRQFFGMAIMSITFETRMELIILPLRDIYLLPSVQPWQWQAI